MSLLNIKERNPKAKSTRAQKVDWLKQHPEFWNMNLYRLRDLMVKEELCSQATSPCDMRLEEIIEELRRQTVAVMPRR